MAMLHRAYAAKPWVPEPQECSWTGQSCLATRCCANACLLGQPVDGKASCSWYTCFQKDNSSAECVTGAPPEHWNGTKLGGHPQRKVPKADDGVLTQGSSLFCFAAVRPSSAGDNELANHAQEEQMGIVECDAHRFIDGLESGSDLDLALYAWRQVQTGGEWRQHDWTVKVDIDTVFLPERLRWHLKELRLPQGSRAYLRNLEEFPLFSSAMQVVSREAFQLFVQKGEQCMGPIGMEGGADYWMLSCFEGLGVDFQSDSTLLSTASTLESCRDDWIAAFPKFRGVKAWTSCRQLSEETWQAEHHDDVQQESP